MVSEKLKTLKELEITSGHPMFNMGAATQYKTMKAEAIKWIQELSLANSGNSHIDEIYEFNHGRVIGWIKHFFEITDEDLK